MEPAGPEGGPERGPEGGPGGPDGGDPACWAHLVCPGCGAIETEGHRGGCSLEEGSGSDAEPAADR